MTDSQFVLELLGDGEWHHLSEIMVRSKIARGKMLTVHSRVAELRKQGYEIVQRRINSGESSYRLVGKREGRVRIVSENPVKGFEYVPVNDGDKRTFNICKIIRRADVSDHEAVDYGPAFMVEFGDGHRQIAYSSELRPWYPT